MLLLHVVSQPSRRKRGIALSFFIVFWFLGLSLGALLAVQAFPSFLSVMRVAVFSNVSIVGMLLSAILPLVATIVVRWVSARFMIVVFAFCKSFVLSFCSVCTFFTFANAAWLIQLFFFFSDLCLIVPQLLLWFAVLMQEERFFREMCLAVFAFTVLITMIDYWVIVPYLATLF